MNTFKELADRFEDATEEAEEAIIFEEIRAKASEDKAGFTAYLQTQSYDLLSDRCIFYEAIGAEPDGWEDFLLAELKGLVKVMENGNEKVSDLLSFDLVCIEFLEDTNYYRDAINFLLPKLDSDNAAVKMLALESILDLMDCGGIELMTAEKRKMQAHLYSSNFKVKKNAYITLKGEDFLPSDFRWTLWDKIRAWL